MCRYLKSGVSVAPVVFAAQEARQSCPSGGL
jgi:hypothetical protein